MNNYDIAALSTGFQRHLELENIHNNNLKNNFNTLVGRIRGKKNITTKRATMLLIVGIVALYAVYFFQAYTMVDGFAVYHVEKMALFHACTTSLSIVMILGLMRTTSSDKATDSDLLLSLPIKKIDIILSKTLGYYLFDFVFGFIMLTPFLINYQILIGFNHYRQEHRLMMHFDG